MLLAIQLKLAWWKPKAGFLLAILFFVVALSKVSFTTFLPIFILSAITLSAIGVWGHLLNDWGDREVDDKAGKKNIFHHKSKAYFFYISTLVFIIAILPWCFLPTTSFSYGLLFVEFLLFIAYAIPPIRLKEKVYLAILTDALYAYALPAVLAFYTYALAFSLHLHFTHIAALFLWSLFIGLRHILYHHVADAPNDKKSGIDNIALKFTLHQINLFIRKRLLPIEIISGVIFFCCFSSSNSMLYMGCVILLYLVFSKTFTSFSTFSLFPNHTLKGASIDLFYQYIWIGVSIIFLIQTEYQYFILLPIVFLLLSNFLSSTVFNTTIYLLQYAYKHYIFTPTSSIVNYSIYYFRKYILSWSEEKNRGVHYDEWKEIKRKEKNGRIALFNQNLNKYTETFVQGHATQLPFQIEFYFGENLLTHQKDGHLISNNLLIKDIKKIVFQLLNIPKEQVLIKHIQKKDIKLLLSEFGTTGAQITKIATATGIPHICIFYGYDAWHKEVLLENKAEYKALFESTQLIIGVSKDICTQLEYLGCLKEKIMYLPCYVNLGLYKAKKIIPKENIFLSVGRFAETKSPHLTILAFKEVLKQIPDAQLRMIGKDGGGELFEACHILVKALKIEDKVHFLGIKTPEEVAEEMQNARVFVQHSLTTPLMSDKEGTPVAIMEAMASGLPIVATKHAGIAELIEHNVSGILVDEYDYLAMSEEMIRVCKSDELVAQLGKSASKTIQENELIKNNIILLKNTIDSYIK